MPGRKPKVVHDRIKEGMSKQQLKDIEDATPIYESQNFVPPKDLTARERKIWDWLVDVFHKTVNCRVSDADVQLMQLYCRAKAAADEADEALKKDPSPYVIFKTGMYDKDGQEKTQLKANPNIKKRHDNMLLCYKYFGELGLSPVARAKAGRQAANAKEEKALWKQFLERTD